LYFISDQELIPYR